MLARRTQLTRQEWSCELPLLVPSFSSKGSAFNLLSPSGRRQYDVAGDLRDFSNLPAKAVLLSAYDLHFEHLDVTDDTGTQSALDFVRAAEVLLLDSGGYELNESFDSCEPRITSYTSREGEGYRLAAYEQVIASIQGRTGLPRLILTSFDWATRGKAIDEQVETAHQLFARFPGHLTSFVLKPVGKQRVVHPDDLSRRDLEALRQFDVVGVTEKELGSGLMDRLKCIAALRVQLNAAGVNAPLHVWGGLDPVITPLYYFAGAQVFDGVSWLRYGYHDGMAVSRDSYQVLSDRFGISHNRVLARGMMTTNNRVFLDNLTLALQSWTDYEGKSFDMFEPGVREPLKKGYDAMKTSIRGV